MSSVALGVPVRKDVTPTDANFAKLHDAMQGVTIWTPDWAAGAQGPAGRRRALARKRPGADDEPSPPSSTSGRSPPAPRKLRGAASTVAFDRVSVAYRGAVVLKPLTLEVAAGEILAMIGPSGSGKTTALRAVAGFVRPAAGPHPHRRRRRHRPAALRARPRRWWCRTTRCFRTCASYDNVAFGLHAQRRAEGAGRRAGRRVRCGSSA